MNEPKLIKKGNKFMNKEKKVLIVSVFLIVILFIGSSYALLTNFDSTDEVITVSTGNLNMTVNNVLLNLNDKLTNASPITLTFTNTGSLNIMKYDVKLVNDSSQTSTLSYNYIKYAISLDGTNYQTPANLGTSNNVIFTGYNLGVNNSKTIYLKVWIDESAGNYALNKVFYGSITVDLYQKAELPGSEAIKSAAVARANDGSHCATTVSEDGITYISGTKSCINFNYVWWSGKMWRITAIYPDGAMKMITDNNISTIAFNTLGQVNYYTKADPENSIAEAKSYMFQWLNEDFLDTLYNHGSDVIDTTKYWNATIPANTNISTKTNNNTINQDNLSQKYSNLFQYKPINQTIQDEEDNKDTIYPNSDYKPINKIPGGFSNVNIIRNDEVDSKDMGLSNVRLLSNEQPYSKYSVTQTKKINEIKNNKDKEELENYMKKGYGTFNNNLNINIDDNNNPIYSTSKSYTNYSSEKREFRNYEPNLTNENSTKDYSSYYASTFTGKNNNNLYNTNYELIRNKSKDKNIPTTDIDNSQKIKYQGYKPL